MLHEFLTSNRTELIELCRAKAAARRTPHAPPAELYHGVPLFLDQLTEMLGKGAQGPIASPPLGASASPADFRFNASATLHGEELRRNDFTIDQVVHDYGDLCQSITELAGEQHAPITVQEFGVLNIRLDNAIASAVIEFTRPRPAPQPDGLADTNERLGVLAHEMRNMLNTTILAISAIKMGSVGFGGATAGALDRSLIGMRSLIDRTLAEVRLDGGLTPLQETIEIGPFIAEVRVAAALEASQKGCELSVLAVEPGMFVQADRHILASAVTNLLQNAFKFTRPGTAVLLTTHATNGRVLIEVADECGGMAEGVQQQIFRPFDQRSTDRSGVGLGLSLSRKGIESLGGILSVRSVPGRGCVFTIDLPRKL
jgi:signal transduction histidine kinase